MKKNTYILILACIFLLLHGHTCYAQFYQKADYSDISVTRKNQIGGYDYYNKQGKIIGYSSKSYTGDYTYYSVEGNKLGTLKKGSDGYTFYNANNIATGSMRQTPTGEYRYNDMVAGGLRSVTPPPGEDIGFFPPSSFLEGTLSSELEGTFEE